MTRLRDPLLYGFKVILLRKGADQPGYNTADLAAGLRIESWMLKCKVRCYPGKGERFVDLNEAHAWAKQHRKDYPDHDARWAAKLAGRAEGQD